MDIISSTGNMPEGKRMNVFSRVMRTIGEAVRFLAPSGDVIGTGKIVRDWSTVDRYGKNAEGYYEVEVDSD